MNFYHLIVIPLTDNPSLVVPLSDPNEQVCDQQIYGQELKYKSYNVHVFFLPFLSNNLVNKNPLNLCGNNEPGMTKPLLHQTIIILQPG